MPTNQAIFGSNRLLNLLTVNGRNSFIEKCDLVSLTLGEVLGNTGDSIRYVFFPVSGIISWEKQITGSPYLVVMLIGNEGMLCISLMLGIDVTPCRAVVQKAGLALRIPADIFNQQIAQNSALNLILKHYTFVAYSQVLQSAACNLFHLLECRLARMLLMFQDRAHSDELHVTQELLAQMLGVRRVGVTKAAGALQRKNLISYSRGNVVIHDKQGLKSASCVCYQTDKTNYENILQHQAALKIDAAPMQLPN